MERLELGTTHIMVITILIKIVFPNRFPCLPIALRVSCQCVTDMIKIKRPILVAVVFRQRQGDSGCRKGPGGGEGAFYEGIYTRAVE